MAVARASGAVAACKLYPAGATTNSESGVTDLERLYPVLAAMAEQGLPLLVHGEVTDAAVDIFDREARFIEERLAPVVAAFPRLKVVFEHVTTEEAVRFVRQGPDTLGSDDHPPPPALQSQRPARRRHPPPRLLPAGPEAGAPPSGPGGGRYQRASALLPGYR